MMPFYLVKLFAEDLGRCAAINTEYDELEVFSARTARGLKINPLPPADARTIWVEMKILCCGRPRESWNFGNGLLRE